MPTPAGSMIKRCGTASGSTWLIITSYRCLINGNIPGTQPGIWHFTSLH